MHTFQWVRWVILSGVCLLLGSCGAIQMVKDTTVGIGRRFFFPQIKTLKLDLIARNALNLDDQGRSLSVVVRIYQLADMGRFQAMTYDNFLHEDKKILGHHLLACKEVVLVPGRAVNIDEAMVAQTHYIGVVAFFRHVDKGDAWRLWLTKKTLSNEKPVKLELNGYRLAVLTSLDPLS